MGDISTKTEKMVNIELKKCPLCGGKLAKLIQHNNNEEKVAYMCKKSTCRIFIDYTMRIYKLSIEYFSVLEEKLNSTINSSEDSCDKNYMLLKEDLSGPMMQKMTNKFDDKEKCRYVIVKAKNVDEATEKFKKAFSVINIKNDMIVEINIEEI